MNNNAMMAQMPLHADANGNGQAGDGSFASNDGWVEVTGGFVPSPSPLYDQAGFGFMHALHSQSMPSSATESYRMGPPPHSHHAHHQQLMPLIVPTHPTWPSMLASPLSNHAHPLSAPPVAMPQMSLSGKPAKLPTLHATPSPRKTLTDNDRRRMCQYHEDNPTVKQTEIGAMFGVERSTVSKVLRQKEKYLFPESGSLSPVKRAKGKFPDIERALSNWVRNTQKQGIPLTDAAIKEKARFFATTVGNNENPLKTNSTSWLEKFKQKNGIGNGKLMRKVSDTNISDAGSGNADSGAGSATQTPVSPSSPSLLPSPLSASKGEDELKTENMSNYFDFSRPSGEPRHSTSQSTTSLSSVMTDAATSTFSGAPSSPMTPFAFSPDGSNGSWLSQNQSRMPPQSNSFVRPRSQTFPNLGIDPAFLNAPDAATPKYVDVSMAETASPMTSPAAEMNQSFSLDAALSPPALHHRSSSGSMGRHSASNSLQSPITPMSPTQDDARRALDVLLTFFQQAPSGLVDQQEYMTVIKLTEKLRLPVTESLPGGLHRINEQDGEAPAIKIETAMLIDG